MSGGSRRPGWSRSSWLDDLDTLAEAGGTATFVIPASGDGLGWRVEGTGPIFAAALREVGYGRIPRTLLGNADGWAVPDRSAVKVVLGDAGWARVEGSEASGQSIELGNTTSMFLSSRGDPEAAALWDSDQEVDAAEPAEPPEPVTFTGWTVLRYGADGSSAVGALSRHPDGSGSSQVFPEADREGRDRMLFEAGRPAPECIGRLTAAGVTGHEARLLRAFEELGADRCAALRKQGEWPYTWALEIAAPVEAAEPAR